MYTLSIDNGGDRGTKEMSPRSTVGIPTSDGGNTTYTFPLNPARNKLEKPKDKTRLHERVD